MTNVIALKMPPRRIPLRDSLPALVPGFAKSRRVVEDVFWLKENAELLGILQCTGQSVPAQSLEAHEPFYASLGARLTFFPQYYRFLLSIGLDLEALGLPGNQMERLCARAANEGLADAELSDLQRAEARRLLARRGFGYATGDAGLDDRLRRFVSRSETFALPNKKAAYELTHIVFYLSEYGRQDPDLPEAAVLSLEYAGILAYLDQNIDLLAEICIAIRFTGRTPNAVWEDAVRTYIATAQVDADDDASLSDSYHTYLVASWALACMGQACSGAPIPQGRCVFRPGRAHESALRAMSASLFSMGAMRVGAWSDMKSSVLDTLDEAQVELLLAAEETSPAFDAFFRHFARVPDRQGLAALH